MIIASFIIAVLSLLFTAFTYFKHDKKLKEQQTIINEYEISKMQKEIVEQKKADVLAFITNVSGMENSSGTLVVKT